MTTNVRRKHPIWHRPGMTDAVVRSILRRPDDPRFGEIAADLLTAAQDPDEIRRWCDLGVLAQAWAGGLRRRIRSRTVRSWYDFLFSAAGTRRPGGAATAAGPSGKRTSPDHMASLARRLRAVAAERGLSAAGIGRRMRVSRQRVHALLAGRSDVTVGTLLRFAEAAGVTLTIEFHEGAPGI